jgi:hypothetical protein
LLNTKPVTCMNKRELYSATFERLTALQSYKLITIRKQKLRVTERGFNFLKHDNKRYYLGKILITDKYQRTKHPDVFLACFKELLSLSEEKRARVRRVLLSGRDYDYDELSDEEYASFRSFIERVHTRCNNEKTIDIVGQVCGLALRNTIVGTISPIDLPVNELSRIINEFDKFEEQVTTHDTIDTNIGIDSNFRTDTDRVKTFVINNMLELHLEDVIRRNFENMFPDLEIIDGNQHYRTKCGTYIDIFCKHKQEDSYVILELKRDKSPSSALMQLLDYMNQIMEEFKTHSVKGILICRDLDRRTKSALDAIRNKLPEANDVSAIEFNLKMDYRQI